VQSEDEHRFVVMKFTLVCFQEFEFDDLPGVSDDRKHNRRRRLYLRVRRVASCKKELIHMMSAFKIQRLFQVIDAVCDFIVEEADLCDRIINWTTHGLSPFTVCAQIGFVFFPQLLFV
jgi:hypothetical protein